MPSSLTSGRSIGFLRKIKKEPGLEDEVGSSQAQPHCPPLPMVLFNIVNWTPNSRQGTVPSKIFRSNTVYLGLYVVSHRANIILAF